MIMLMAMAVTLTMLMESLVLCMPYRSLWGSVRGALTGMDTTVMLR